MFTLRLFLALTTMTMMTINCEVFTADFNTPYDFKYFDKIDLPVEEDFIVEPNADQKRLTKSCSPSKGLFLSGDYVKLSDFVGFNGSFQNECQAKLVFLFASRELIIDRDLAVADRDLRVTIIAPKWKVSGFRKLDLEVGTFLGISETIFNEENLIMTSSRKNKLNKIIKLGTGTEMPFSELFTNYNSSATFDTQFRDLKRGKRDVKRQVFPPKNAYVINYYKGFLREESANQFQHKQIMKFYDVLEKHDKVQKYYSALSFVNEFDDLENEFFADRKSNSKTDFYPLYQSLLNRISRYAKDETSSENSADHKTIYKFLYTAALSKMSVIKNNTEPNLIVDIDVFMKMVVTKFEELKQISTDFKKANSIEKHNKDYKERFERKINESMSFIQQEVMPEIDKINDLMDTQIKQLVDEIKDKVGEAEREKEKALENQRKMAENMVLGKIFSVLKGATQLVSFLGPVGSAIGTAVGAVTSIVESGVTHDVTAQRLTKIPDGATEGFSQFVLLMKSEKTKQIKEINKTVAWVKTKLNNTGMARKEEFSGSYKAIANLETSLTILEKEVDYDPRVIKSVQEQFKSSLEKEKADLEEEIKSSGDKNSKNVERLEKLGEVVQGISSTGIEIFNRITDDKNNLDEASAAVKEAEKKLKILQEYEDQIYDFLIPMKQQMFGSMNKMTGELKNISLAALDVKKWRVQSALRDTQLNLRKATADFAVSDHMVRSVEKLEEAMTTLINIYDRIENFEEQKHLADYIKDITSDAAIEKTIDDPELNTAFKKLEIVIKSNVLINEYDLTLRALEQWLFPFADQYLGRYQLPANVFGSSNNSTLAHIISTTGKHIGELSRALTSYNAVVEKFDEYIYETDFNNEGKSFSEWSNERFKEEISSLLKGKQVSFLANIETSDKNKEAIKFKEIKLNFKTKNTSAQNDLNEVLKGFMISATHSGNSYYRFNNHIYAFNCENQTINYSFENKQDGTPSTANKVYKKIKNGILMLSPYTMWRLQLLKYDGGDFNKLEPFINDVSIELTGHGSFVNMNFKNTKSMVRYLLY